MKLTRLSAAPGWFREHQTRGAASCPRRLETAGTASQLIAGVRRTQWLEGMRRAGRVALMALAASQALAVGGWRLPSAWELGQEWRAASAHRYAAVAGDFDGDGQLDHARLMLGLDGHKGALVVQFGGTPTRSIVLDEVDDANWLDVMGIDLVTPGQFQTACGKGYWECASGEPEMLVVTLPAISYFAHESAESYFVFDRKKRAFRRVWMSD